MKAQAIRKHMKDLGYNFAPRPKEFVFYPQSGLKVVAVFFNTYIYIMLIYVYNMQICISVGIRYVYIYMNILELRMCFISRQHLPWLFASWPT